MYKRSKFTPITVGWLKSKTITDKRGCWIWSRSTTRGYATVGDRHHKTKRGHRLIWELIHGPIPAGLNVCHHCDVKRCINPDHLYAGTQKQNIQDALARGRLKSEKKQWFLKTGGTNEPQKQIIMKQITTKPKSKCLVPNCKSTASSRGLCHSCYGQASELVRTKVTTWGALEKAGRCLPSNRHRPGTKQWLLKAKV